MLIWEKGHHCSWMADRGFYYLHWPEEFRKAKDNKGIDKRWGHIVWNFFPGIKNFILLIWKKKKIPKGMHGNFWHSNTSPFEYLSINPWVTGKYFLNPSISNPSERDYTWNFKCSNLLFLHMAIVKLLSTNDRTSTFCQYLGEWGHAESQDFWATKRSKHQAPTSNHWRFVFKPLGIE